MGDSTRLQNYKRKTCMTSYEGVLTIKKKTFIDSLLKEFCFCFCF